MKYGFPMVNSSQDKSFLLIKVAGGATSQCLALMNAIYLKNKIGKNFKIKYFPYSTGTYWPFAIDFLINKEEFISEIGITKGFDEKNNSKDLKAGKIINNHPLQSKFLNYERLLVFIRKLGFESKLLRLRGEIAIVAAKSNLDRVSKKTKAISGGYAAIVDKQVSLEMNTRFITAGLKSPFSKSEMTNREKSIVIHYRIGDKRATFTNPLVGKDGITDPIVFRETIDSMNLTSEFKIYVISDEPTAAQELLAGVGIFAEKNPTLGDIWEDLYFMSQASIFIGSWSQVSQLAALCVINNGGLAYCPSSNLIGDKSAWKIDGATYYRPKFLDRSNEIYDTGEEK